MGVVITSGGGGLVGVSIDKLETKQTDNYKVTGIFVYSALLDQCLLHLP